MEPICDFLLVFHYTAIFHRLRVTSTYWSKISVFSPFFTHPSVAHPSVVWSPRKGVALGPMLWKLVRKTRPWATRWWKPRDSTVISFVSKTQYQCATEGRTDGQICMSMPKSNSVHGWALQKCSASELLSTPNFWHLPNDVAQFLCGSWASC